MEWQQLEYFQTVARMQHMTRAAELLCISQPALSRSMARLEAELGVPLFERQGRSIQLNRYGQLFLERVNRIMKEFDEGKKELQELNDPEYGEVSLGFLHTLGTHLIPDLIGSFRARYPNVNFQLNQNFTDSLLEKLESGEIDLCLVTSTETKLQTKWTELWREELCVIVPVHHPLAECETVWLEQFAEEPFIFFKKGYGLRRITDQLCQEAGFIPRITFEGEEVPTIAGLVGAGLGVSIIPEVTGLDRSKITPLRVKTPKSERAIGMAWVEGKYLSPTARKFRQFVMEYFKKI